MADIQDVPSFVGSHWDWKRNGVEKLLGAEVTDIDAHVMFPSGDHLFIETKHWHGKTDAPPLVNYGQLQKLHALSYLGPTLVIHGCGHQYDPLNFQLLHMGAAVAGCDLRKVGDQDKRQHAMNTEFRRLRDAAKRNAKHNGPSQPALGSA